jgi:epoxyqueuosine reductase QueG
MYFQVRKNQISGELLKVDLTPFFREQGVDVFAEVSIDNLPDKDRSSVVHFFPDARFVIVFGKEVPVPVYLMPPKEKTREMLRIAEGLDETAARLSARLEGEHIPALPVPLYLPVRIADGRVQGVVRLKQAAAAGGLGSLGGNTVLISPRFGPRLLLGGVVTAHRAGGSDQLPVSAGPEAAPVCTGCGHCISVCPEGALGPDGVDTFRCRTVHAWVPSFLVPAIRWMIGRTIVLRCMAPLAPWIARTATIRCSLCVTKCPVFSGNAE